MIKQLLQDILAIIFGAVVVTLLLIGEYIILPLVYLVGKATDKVKEVIPTGK